MDNFVIGNMVWNGALVATAWWFFKKWMNGVEDEAKETKHTHAKSTELIIQNIKDNREFYSHTYDKLDTKIDLLTLESARLSLYQKEANGKVGIMATKLETVGRELKTLEAEHRAVLNSHPCIGKQ
jgi:hypothetical protein